MEIDDISTIDAIVKVFSGETGNRLSPLKSASSNKIITRLTLHANQELYGLMVILSDEQEQIQEVSYAGRHPVAAREPVLLGIYNVSKDHNKLDYRRTDCDLFAFLGINPTEPVEPGVSQKIVMQYPKDWTIPHKDRFD
jgi:hypothetical protein